MNVAMIRSRRLRAISSILAKFKVEPSSIKVKYQRSDVRNQLVAEKTIQGKDASPCGVLISTQAEYDPQGFTPRGERKGAKGAKFGEDILTAD